MALKMNSKKSRAFVIGVGMTKFEKPGRREKFDYPDMVFEAGTKALEDAKISYDQVQQAVAGYCFGDSTCGQRALYGLGLTGIPIINVNNNCSTGSTALMVARQVIEGGLADCVMAVGFEKMERGSIESKFVDRKNPLDKHVSVMLDCYDFTPAPVTSQLFGNAGLEHMKRYGTKPEHFAKIAWKNHKHSTNNPNSQFQKEYTLEEIMKSNRVHEYLTLLQCCPTSDGAACAILASEAFVEKHGLFSQAVEILAQAMATDLPSTFNEKSMMKVVGYDMTRKAADEVYKMSGLTADDIQVVELHDCFSANELLTYEALRLCPEGKAGEYIDQGANTYGGKHVVNPSGGLISKGHPLGATGVAQCAELCWQLRSLAGKRQVAGAKVALQHNLGLGGAAVVTLYKLGYPGHQTMKGDVATDSVNEDDFAVKSMFEYIGKELEKKGKEYVEKIKGIYCFKVSKQNKEGTWVIDVKNGNGSVKFDPQGKGDVTLTMEDEDLMKVMQGKMNPQQAFFQGKLKVAGNMGLAMKLQQLLPKVPKAKL